MFLAFFKYVKMVLDIFYTSFPVQNDSSTTTKVAIVCFKNPRFIFAQNLKQLKRISKFKLYFEIA